jgi:hypothetical protein
MPHNLRYSSHLSAEAVTFVISLSKSRQRIVLEIAERIAEHPTKISDYRTKDAVGRDIDNLRVGKYIFTYWVDHAVKEVRITDIVSL